MLAVIWAQNEEGLIGKENHLPWHLPNDLKFFKQMTENNTIIMGRKTFEGMGSRLLPNRETIILTTDLNYQVAGATVLHDISSVISYSEANEGITFVAGGSLIYKELLPYCKVLYRTVITGEFEGDAYFPTIDWDQWHLVSVSDGEVDEKNLYPHSFETYQRVD
ncbi:dihydrofolate reductase [Enterococcus sp. PF1-24]|uniref:dihydrofolate reductase n=1 Tax=unclassified Enterococcus TaxID=2608891 RepID=UPI002474E6A4|nr:MULTISPECIES: dihydrofolate reductase [unclassified Enterococcus]MDH6364729.1 dihydrofolate reductase [Enterococcus sp. PFB1-1]MDH6401795.1 dihydrofolate reductase [Enterococcus sp. PF1-24]